MSIYYCIQCGEPKDDDWDPANECPWDGCENLCGSCAAELEEQDEQE